MYPAFQFGDATVNGTACSKGTSPCSSLVGNKAVDSECCDALTLCPVPLLQHFSCRACFGLLLSGLAEILHNHVPVNR